MKIKKAVAHNGLAIKLYDVDWSKAGSETIGNIEAFHANGDLAWRVEVPTYGFHYYDMQIDEDANQLEADSGSGRIYIIDVSNGRIVGSFVVK